MPGAAQKRGSEGAGGQRAFPGDLAEGLRLRPAEERSPLKRCCAAQRPSLTPRSFYLLKIFSLRSHVGLRSAWPHTSYGAGQGDCPDFGGGIAPSPDVASRNAGYGVVMLPGGMGVNGDHADEDVSLKARIR